MVVSHFIMLKLNFMIRATILILSICTYSKNPHNNLHFLLVIVVIMVISGVMRIFHVCGIITAFLKSKCGSKIDGLIVIFGSGLSVTTSALTTPAAF